MSLRGLTFNVGVVPGEGQKKDEPIMTLSARIGTKSHEEWSRFLDSYNNGKWLNDRNLFLNVVNEEYVEVPSAAQIGAGRYDQRIIKLFE